MSEQDREPGKYLDTLALRCTPELVGPATVYVRALDAETRKLWDDFDKQCQKQYRNDDARAPYSIATIVLSALSGGYVHFDPDWNNPFIASREPMSDALLQKVFTLTHSLAAGVPIGAVDLGRPPEVARRIASTEEVAYRLAEYVAGKDGVQPSVPGWVYKTIAWDLSQRLSKIGLLLHEGGDGRDDVRVTLRPDNTGGLVAVDFPWENEKKGRFALSRTSLRLKTVPNITNPVLILDSRVTRISASQVFASTALAVQDGDGLPVLEITLNGRGGARTVNRLALEALGRLRMDYGVLRAVAERAEREQKLMRDAREAGQPIRFPTGHPGVIWPVLPKNRPFPIGTGVGMEHLRLLHRHILDVLGDAAEPLSMREVSMTLPHRPTDPEKVSAAEIKRRKAEREETGEKTPLRPRGSAFPTAEAVVASVSAAGFKKLTIVCLWYRDETRLRMLGTLAKVFGLQTVGLDPADGVELALHGDQITAVFHCAPGFLQPGGPDGRRDALAEAGVHLGADGVLVGAWCETEMPVADDETGLTGGDDTDGKHQSKAVLAPLDVASQYLKGKDDVGPIKPKKGTDHPAEAALLDLYRSLGVIDDRVANALAPEKAGHAVDRIAHVGIHIRQQNNRPGEKGSPKIVVTAAALVPPSASCGTWTMLGWSSTRPLWQSYRAAQNSFHASAYPAAGGEKRSYRQKWDDAAEIVERAVADLAEELDGVPYVVTVEETSARRCWDGIQNVHQGTSPTDRNSKYWLPGHTLSPGDRPLAVIRVNTDGEEVPQPVGTSRHYRQPDAEPKPGMTATGLFEVATDFDSPVWILCNVPRAFAGKGGRLGENHTRWDAEPSVYSEDPAKRRKGEMGQNWYTMTATEIYPIVRSADMTAEALAVATAKLCHQALTWSDRVRLPVPLHAAKQMDLDHPQYRRTAPPEEKLEAEPGAEDSGVDQQSSADEV